MSSSNGSVHDWNVQPRNGATPLAAPSGIPQYGGSRSIGHDLTPADLAALEMRWVDPDLARGIVCYAANLPEKGEQVAPADVEAVGQILLIASKIIGNGSPIAATSQPKLASATAVAVPKRRPVP